MNSSDERDFWRSRKELAHLQAWARHRRGGPWATLGAALVRVVVRTPRQIQLPYKGSLNLYVGIIGAPGMGKGVSTTAAADSIDLGAPIRKVGVGSGEGLVHQYVYRDSKTHELVRKEDELLVDIPEIDTLASQTARSGSTILGELRKAWVGEALGFAYADPNKNLSVEEHTYRLGIIAGIQPERAGVLLDDVGGGTPQRFLWLPVGDPNPPANRPAEPPVLRWRNEELSVAIRRGPRVLPVCERVNKDQDEFDNRRLRGELQPHETHEMLARLKVASALGLLSGHFSVNEEDWELSALVMEKSNEARESVEQAVDDAKNTEARERGKRAYVANSAYMDEDRAIRKVAELVFRHVPKDDVITHSKLRRAVRDDKRKYVEHAVKLLEDKGLIVIEELEKGGRRYTRPRRD